MGIFGEQPDLSSLTYRMTDVDSTIITQAVLMILTTEEGTYIDAPEIGFPLEEMIGSSLTSEEVSRFASRMARAIEQDERIERADVTLSASPGPSVRVRFAVDVKPVDADPIPLLVDVLDESIDVQVRN